MLIMSQKESRKRTFSESNQLDIICDKCMVTFTQKKNFYAHMRKFHGMTTKGNQSCGLCDGKFLRLSQLQEHLQDQHDVNLNFMHETFYCESDFFQWKQKIEKDNQASFVYKSTREIKNGIKFSYFVCHRSGVPDLKVDRVRHLKATGSIKCGSTCPANINLTTQTVDGVSEMKVEYQSVHVGHDLEAGKLRLSKERASFASLLSSGVPMTKILDQTRLLYSPTKRCGLTTRKDLHNVSRDYKINKIILHPDDSAPVAMSTVTQETESDDNLVDINMYKEKEAITSSLSGNSQNSASEKKKVLDELLGIHKRLEACDSAEVFQHIRTYLKPISAYLESLDSSQDHQNLTEKMHAIAISPVNQIYREKKIFALKKRVRSHPHKFTKTLENNLHMYN